MFLAKTFKAKTGKAKSRIILAALPVALLLGACDAASVVLWPWVEVTGESSADAGAGLPPPPLTPVDPLDPDRVNPPPPGPAGPQEETPTIENPNANPGAPDEGTPFVEKPEDPAVPISDTTPPVSAETGEPIDLPPPPSEGEPTAPPPAEPGQVVAPSFYYFRPGALEAGSGTGALEASTLVPDMMFPIKDAPAFPQSQVYRWGGGVKGGDQCDLRNFAAPWRDNYCEKRSSTNTTPWCSVTGVHLGQDIRVGTPEGCRTERSTKAADRTKYEVVAVEDGVISNVGSYSITLRANAGGRIYRYLHLNMAKLKVATGAPVKKGDVIGYVSNDFGGTPTTLHLHFEIKLNTTGSVWAYAPPYSSLLAAYQRRENNPGEMVADNFVVASSPR